MTRTVVVGALLLSFAAGVGVGVCVRFHPNSSDARLAGASPPSREDAYYGKVVRPEKVLYIHDFGAGPVLLAPVRDERTPPPR